MSTSIKEKIAANENDYVQMQHDNTFAGTQYEQMQQMNPYANGPAIKRTWWDKFVNGLGLNSKYDKAVAEYQKAYDEYNAQIAQKSQEESYNSAAQQKLRMQQAGINPDLQDISAGEATGFDQTMTSPDVSGTASDIADGVGSVTDFIDRLKNGLASVMSITQGGFDFASSLEGLKSQKLSNSSSSLQGAISSSEFAKSLSSFFIHPSDSEGLPILDPHDDTLHRTQYDFVSSLRRNMIKRGMSKSQANSVSDFVISYLNSDEYFNTVLDNYNKGAEGRSKFRKSHDFDPFYVNHGMQYTNDQGEFTLEFMKHINKSILNTYKHMTHYTEKFNKFNSDYWSKRDGLKQGEFEQSKLDFDTQVLESQKAMRKAFYDCVKWLSDIANDPSAGVMKQLSANTALTTMFIGSSGLLPNVSYDFKSGPKGGKSFHVGF